MVKIVSAGLVGICLVCLTVSGCGDRQEPQEAETEAVVRQILPDEETQPETVADPETVTETDPEEQVVEAPDDVAAEAEDEITATVDPDKAMPPETAAEIPEPAPAEEVARVEPGVEPEPETAAPETAEPETAEPETAAPDVEVDPDMAEAEMRRAKADADAPVIEFDFEPDDIAAEALPDEDLEAEDQFYNPFAPLFQKETAATLDLGDPGVRAKREFLTPLERIDLGQLELEGIILAESGNRAIVSDASGKGYVLRKGTYLGLNSGQVDSIESDRIVVVEEVGDRTQKVVLKLQKPAGE